MESCEYDAIVDSDVVTTTGDMVSRHNVDETKTHCAQYAFEQAKRVAFGNNYRKALDPAFWGLSNGATLHHSRS